MSETYVTPEDCERYLASAGIDVTPEECAKAAEIIDRVAFVSDSGDVVANTALRVLGIDPAKRPDYGNPLRWPDPAPE